MLFYPLAGLGFFKTKLPDLSASMIWLSPFVNFASNNSSPSLIVIAATPFTWFRIFLQ
jgi:hypothetical protein